MDTEVNSSPLEKALLSIAHLVKKTLQRQNSARTELTLTNLNEAGMIRQGRIFILTRSLFLNTVEVCVGRLNYNKKYSSRIEL